jgi:hypothetical protein
VYICVYVCFLHLMSASTHFLGQEKGNKSKKKEKSEATAHELKIKHFIKNGNIQNLSLATTRNQEHEECCWSACRSQV